jgi:hypothetical protein
MRSKTGPLTSTAAVAATGVPSGRPVTEPSNDSPPKASPDVAPSDLLAGAPTRTTAVRLAHAVPRASDTSTGRAAAVAPLWITTATTRDGASV